MTCGNCGGKHDTKECTKPRIALDKHACFECGGIGHNARKCPKKCQNGVRNVNEDEVADAYFGCLTESTPRPRATKAGKPQPQDRTLGAFMPKAPVKTSNSFEALAGAECTIERKKGRKQPVGTAPTGVRGAVGERTPTTRRPKHLTIGQIQASLSELEEVCISDDLCVVVDAGLNPGKPLACCQENGIPGFHRGFSQAETDDLYREVRA